MEKIIIHSDANSAPKRTDVALSEQLSHLSRSQVLAMIKSGEIARVDGAKIKPAKSFEGSIEFIVEPRQLNSDAITPQNIKLDILFHDEHLAIINKPVGMVVHPGAGVKDGTLCNALMHRFPHMAVGDAHRPGIVHRLDKNTSGVMVVAKTHLAHRLLSDLFKGRAIKKIYRAYCFGEIKSGPFELKTGHARHPHNRLKFFTGLAAPKVASTNVRLAHTSFEVLQTGFGISEVRAELHTGRTHQIRAHLGDIGHPLLGDILYGGKRPMPKAMPNEFINAISALNGQALHAEILEFVHPITQAPLKFSAPMPAELAALERVWRK